MLASNDFLQKRYRIIRQLGKGGMGAVYEVEDKRRSAFAQTRQQIRAKRCKTRGKNDYFAKCFECGE